MSIQTVKNKDTKPFVVIVNGEPLFGIMSNVTIQSEAGALSLKELNQVLFSGMHEVSLKPYVKKVRDFSEKKTALLTPSVVQAEEPAAAVG